MKGIPAVAFSPDVKTVLPAFADATLPVWHATNESLHAPKGCSLAWAGAGVCDTTQMAA